MLERASGVASRASLKVSILTTEVRQSWTLDRAMSIHVGIAICTVAAQYDYLAKFDDGGFVEG